MKRLFPISLICFLTVLMLASCAEDSIEDKTNRGEEEVIVEIEDENGINHPVSLSVFKTDLQNNWETVRPAEFEGQNELMKMMPKSFGSFELTSQTPSEFITPEKKFAEVINVFRDETNGKTMYCSLLNLSWEPFSIAGFLEEFEAKNGSFDQSRGLPLYTFCDEMNEGKKNCKFLIGLEYSLSVSVENGSEDDIWDLIDALEVE